MADSLPPESHGRGKPMGGLIGMNLNPAVSIALAAIIIAAGIPAGDALTITAGSVAAGEIDVSGGTNTYEFTATAKDRIIVRMQSEWSGGPWIRLFCPAGILIRSAYSPSDNCELVSYSLPATGRYSFTVGDYQQPYDTGRYSIYLQNTKNPGNSVPILYGQTLTGSIAEKTEMQAYRFTGSAGDAVSAGVTADWSDGPLIRLYNPAGILIGEARSITRDCTLAPVSLPSDGAYTLLVGDYAGMDGTGGYSLTLQGPADAQVNLPSQRVLKGSAATMDLEATGLDGAGSVTFELTYLLSVMTVTGVSSAGTVPGMVVNADIDNSIGSAAVTLSSPAGMTISGPAPVARIAYVAEGDFGESCTVGIVNAEWTDLGGAVHPLATDSGSVAIAERGDLTCNGLVDWGDVVRCAYMAWDRIEASVLLADYNGNGMVDWGDVVRLAYYYQGAIGTL